MKDKLVFNDFLIDEQLILSFDEFCHSCEMESHRIIQFVEYGVIEPEGSSPEQWCFSAYHLNRIQRACRLQRDLQVNLEALGLVLDLIEEVQELRRKMLHFNKS